MNNVKRLPNIPEINKVPAAVYDQWEKYEPKFLIVGIRKQPQTGQYQPHSFHLPTQEELLKSVADDSLTHAKVYTVVPDVVNIALLRQQGKEFVKDLQEKAEYEHYLKLDKIYGKKKELESLPAEG